MDNPDNSDNITLETFIQREINFLKSFEKHWITNNSDSPDVYPLVTDEITWLEMYMYYQSGLDAIINPDPDE